MKVALLSHRGGNIGHDFMAAGWETILKLAFGPQVEIQHFEQHRPFCVYPAGHALHYVDRLPYGRARWLKAFLATKLAGRWFWPQARATGADVAVACGGPNIVQGAGHSVEMRLMFHHLIGAFHAARIPVVDAAVGACFPLEKVPQQIDDPVDAAYFRRLFDLTAASTVRDSLAQRLWRTLGRDASLIPCAAMASGVELERLGGAQTAEYVLINYQRFGANEDWGQHVDADEWRERLQVLVERLARRHRITFICHSDSEAALAAQHFPEHNRYQPRDVREYAAIAMKAKAILASRVHATIPLAGAGIPGVQVGTDTRIGAIDLIGLPTRYVKRADAESMEATLEDLIARRAAEKERLLALRASTMERYKQVIMKAMETTA
jgi:hypothetical protein